MAFSDAWLQGLRLRMPEYMERAHGVNVLRGNMRCPRPGHRDSTPSVGYDRKSCRLHCFGCGAKWDVFDVAGRDAGTDAFPEKVARVCDVLGVPVEEEGPSPYRRKARKRRMSAPTARERREPPEPVEGGDVLETVQEAAFALFDEPRAAWALAHLRGRGFTDEEIMRNGWGWVAHPSEMFPDGFGGAPSVPDGYICIPFPEGEGWDAVRYCAFRECAEGAARKAKEWNRKGAPSPIWREHLLAEPGNVYVCEGVFDAAAVMAMRPGSKACAICGESGVERLLAAVENAPAGNRPALALALDDDEAGRRMAGKLARGLREMGARFKEVPGFGGCKDPCDMLAAYRKGDE